MKTIITKIITAAITIFFCIVAKAQDCDLISHLDDTKADERIATFEGLKAEFIRSQNISTEGISIKVTLLKSFLGVLHNNASYDGLRVYFGIKTMGSDSGKIVLILNPTTTGTGIGPGGYKKSIDDKKNTYILSGNSIEGPYDINKVEYKYVAEWISAYKRLAKKIQIQLKKDDILIKEAISVWYSDKVLFRKIENYDLLDYLTNCDTTIETIDLNYGCWTVDPGNTSSFRFIYKTDIIFFLNDGTSRKAFTLTKFEIINNLKQQVKNINSVDFAEYADTGLPCPPYKCPQQ